MKFATIGDEHRLLKAQVDYLKAGSQSGPGGRSHSQHKYRIIEELCHQHGVTNFPFRNGPIEDMYAVRAKNITDKDMILNKFVHNWLAYVFE